MDFSQDLALGTWQSDEGGADADFIDAGLGRLAAGELKPSVSSVSRGRAGWARCASVASRRAVVISQARGERCWRSELSRWVHARSMVS